MKDDAIDETVQNDKSKIIKGVFKYPALMNDSKAWTYYENDT